jgi:parallel beta-helix repeat protein
MEVTMRTCVLLLTFLFLLVFTSTTHAVTVFVPDDFNTIQTALDSCANGDTVVVRDGTYTGDGNRDIDFTGKAIVLMSENGPEVTIIDCEGNSSEYHRGFYFHSGEDLSTVVQGFTITNGYNTYGGGIYCYNSSPTITGNIITDNSTREIMSGEGGGIYCTYSSPAITDNVISGNFAYQGGGGISCRNNSDPVIRGNTITGNTSSATDWAGGGIFCDNSSPIINGNTITVNTANNIGGGIYFGYYSYPTIEGNTITGNMAQQSGGGIFGWASDPIITGNTITGNSVTYNSGGGICTSEGSWVIETNTISGNTAFYGGGISFNYSSSTLSGNIIADNAGSLYGGGIDMWYSSATMYNNTFAENYAAISGGGIACYDSSEVMISNFISWNNDAPSGSEIGITYLQSSVPSTLTISYSDVEGGEGGVFVDTGCTLNWGDGMINADPLFMTYKGYDYLLDVGSPCIDAGDPTIEDGISDWHPRWPDWLPNGPESDMGAYGGPGNKGWVK